MKLITTIAGFFGVPSWAVIGALIGLVLVGGGISKCAYDRSVIDRHETKQELKQARRERTADANLQQQKTRDGAATQQRQEEIDNATRNIPDQKPSDRQRARACLELQRQAKQRGQHPPAC